MSDSTKENPPLVTTIRLTAYKAPEASVVRAPIADDDRCACEGKMGKGAGGTCKCGSQAGGGTD
jgi:hypothetical protein